MLKKTFLYFLLLLFLSGCSDDLYSVERQYWFLQRKIQDVLINPKATPPKQVQDVVNATNEFIAKYPKIRLIINAEFYIASIYAATEDYNGARRQLKSIMSKYNKDKSIIAECFFIIGNTYKAENKWGLALEQYKKIMSDYALTNRGIMIPMYIVQYYRTNFKPDLMMDAYNDAVVHYQKIANTYPNKPVAYVAHDMILRCYIEQKEWKKAAALLDFMSREYKGRVMVDAILFDLAGIYLRQLNDKPRAKDILSQIIREYPRGTVAKTASKILKLLDK